MLILYPVKLVKINKLDKILAVLQSGGVIALPTDTTYGLAADATNHIAVKKVFDIKGRSPEKQLSWFFAGLEMVKNYCQLTHSQLSIINSYLPGPYTFIVPSKKPRATIAVRITAHPITQKIVGAFDKPLTATSANLSGQPAARTVDEVKNLDADLIVDGGTLPKSLPSTVVDLTQNPPKILRQGAGQFPKPI